MTSSTIPIAQKHILLVEDNGEVRRLIARALEIENFAVHQAEDGQAALTQLQRHVPDLILSDVNMPRMNGIEFYKAVRQNPRWLPIPFIFLTSHDSKEDIQAGRELGVEDYLTKPINNDDLVRIINARLYRSTQIQLAHIEQAYLETVNVLANTIEGRDPYTSGHVERVTKYARQIAEALQWPADHLRTLEFGARLHDIGKIIVPDQILKKASSLTPEEWDLMKQHTVAGAKIMQNITHLRGGIPYVLYHHEKWDGSGYPKGLKGRDIPVEARLMAIADVYDALTTTRPYHPARPTAEVIKFLQIKAGSHFDPDLTEIFLQRNYCSAVAHS
jgi:putative two-component system response regulator